MARKPNKPKIKPREDRPVHPIYGLLTEEEYNARHGAKTLVFDVYPVMRKCQQNRFAVGDLLNRWMYHSSAKGEERTKFYDCLDRDHKLKRIIQVVCIDDVGLIYTRLYGTDGRLCVGIQCLHADNWEYELDSDYQDSILLGDGKMSGAEAMKAKLKYKAEVDRHNSKLEVKLSLEQIVKLVNERAVDGGSIWFKQSQRDKCIHRMVITKPIPPNSLTCSYETHWMDGVPPSQSSGPVTMFQSYIFFSEEPRRY